MHDLTDPDLLMTCGAIALLADPPVTPERVRQWADEGRIPCVRTSSGVRLFRRADVLHHLHERYELGPRAGRRHE